MGHIINHDTVPKVCTLVHIHAGSTTVRHRFVREDEVAETQDQLLLHWSAKETAFKILNRNKVDFLKHLRVLPFDMADEGSFVLQEYKTNDEEQLTVHYKVFPDFVLTYSIQS